MQTYRTAEIASIIGIHPNTVRFYEEQALLPPIPRTENGYRLYNNVHLRLLQLIRLGFQSEILSNNLRNEVIQMIKTAATGNYVKSIEMIRCYQKQLLKEIQQAKEAIILTTQMISDSAYPCDELPIENRREAAKELGISTHVLRDWERNGLILIPRNKNRRQYGCKEMNTLKIIGLLRRANYSQTAIRQMLVKLNQGETDLLSAIDTPDHTQDIISVTDRYITSLTGALKDTENMLELLHVMIDENKASINEI